ncbi:MAG: hypothetical protein JW946_03105 [Candidatus Omnitrophica bacterium]|nr:hypothetical protein [Candidatus Omnitrophota bacterium]
MMDRAETKTILLRAELIAKKGGEFKISEDQKTIIDKFRRNEMLKPEEARTLLEVVTNFKALEEKAEAIRFKTASETTTNLIRQPLQDLIAMTEEGTAARVYLQKLFERFLTEEGADADLLINEVFRSPGEIARSIYRHAAARALGIWQEIVKSKELGADAKWIKFEANEKIRDILTTDSRLDEIFDNASEYEGMTFAEVPSANPAEYVAKVVASISKSILPSEGDSVRPEMVKAALKESFGRRAASAWGKLTQEEKAEILTTLADNLNEKGVTSGLQLIPVAAYMNIVISTTKSKELKSMLLQAKEEMDDENWDAKTNSERIGALIEILRKKLGGTIDPAKMTKQQVRLAEQFIKAIDPFANSKLLTDKNLYIRVQIYDEIDKVKASITPEKTKAEVDRLVALGWKEKQAKVYVNIQKQLKIRAVNQAMRAMQAEGADFEEVLNGLRDQIENVQSSEGMLPKIMFMIRFDMAGDSTEMYELVSIFRAGDIYSAILKNCKDGKLPEELEKIAESMAVEAIEKQHAPAQALNQLLRQARRLVLIEAMAVYTSLYEMGVELAEVVTMNDIAAVIKHQDTAIDSFANMVISLAQKVSRPEIKREAEMHASALRKAQSEKIDANDLFKVKELVDENTSSIEGVDRKPLIDTFLLYAFPKANKEKRDEFSRVFSEQYLPVGSKYMDEAYLPENTNIGWDRAQCRFVQIDIDKDLTEGEKNLLDVLIASMETRPGGAFGKKTLREFIQEKIGQATGIIPIAIRYDDDFGKSLNNSLHKGYVESAVVDINIGRLFTATLMENSVEHKQAITQVLAERLRHELMHSDTMKRADAQLKEESGMYFGDLDMYIALREETPDTKVSVDNFFNTVKPAVHTGFFYGEEEGVIGRAYGIYKKQKQEGKSDKDALHEAHKIIVQFAITKHGHQASQASVKRWHTPEGLDGLVTEIEQRIAGGPVQEAGPLITKAGIVEDVLPQYEGIDFSYDQGFVCEGDSQDGAMFANMLNEAGMFINAVNQMEPTIRPEGFIRKGIGIKVHVSESLSDTMGAVEDGYVHVIFRLEDVENLLSIYRDKNSSKEARTAAVCALALILNHEYNHTPEKPAGEEALVQPYDSMMLEHIKLFLLSKGYSLDSFYEVFGDTVSGRYVASMEAEEIAAFAEPAAEEPRQKLSFAEPTIRTGFVSQYPEAAMAQNAASGIASAVKDKMQDKEPAEVLEIIRKEIVQNHKDILRGDRSKCERLSYVYYLTGQILGLPIHMRKIEASPENHIFIAWGDKDNPEVLWEATRTETGSALYTGGESEIITGLRSRKIEPLKLNSIEWKEESLIAENMLRKAIEMVRTGNIAQAQALANRAFETDPSRKADVEPLLNLAFAAHNNLVAVIQRALSETDLIGVPAVALGSDAITEGLPQGLKLIVDALPQGIKMNVVIFGKDAANKANRLRGVSDRVIVTALPGNTIRTQDLVKQANVQVVIFSQSEKSVLADRKSGIEYFEIPQVQPGESIVFTSILAAIFGNIIMKALLARPDIKAAMAALNLSEDDINKMNNFFAEGANGLKVIKPVDANKAKEIIDSLKEAEVNA